jgi:hypothetical protein
VHPCSSSMTGRSPVMRVAASAKECASVASVLRPCPVANTRVRADSLGGKSTTCSPSASSLRAMCLPMPWHLSTAQVRSDLRRTARYPDASVPYRPPPSTASSEVMSSIVATTCADPSRSPLRSSQPSTHLAGHLRAREGTATSSCANPS